MSADKAALRFGAVARDRLDAGEPDLAAVVETKAARIDDGGDAAFALRLETRMAAAIAGPADDSAQKPHANAAKRRMLWIGDMTPLVVRLVPVCLLRPAQYYRKLRRRGRRWKSTASRIFS